MITDHDRDTATTKAFAAPSDVKMPALPRQMYNEAAWLRSGNQQDNPTWLRARLKMTADLLDESADYITKLEIAARP